MRLLSYPIQWLDVLETTRDNIEGELPAMVQDAGFENVQTLESINTVFGTLAINSPEKRETSITE
jgi:hypothetical protein|tara:strand:+ start:1259 stop:1453 length:195 start_codon:yes stop_codon:yes gene_type:complete